MSWLILIFSSIVIDALIIFIDNFISDTYFKGRQSAGQKVVHGYCFTIVPIILALVMGLDFSKIQPIALLLIFASGIVSSFASILYYRALEIEDSTNLSIFFQLAPILYLLYDCLILGRSFSWAQLVAFCLIIAAPILIVLTSRKNARKTKIKAIALTFFYVLISVVGHICFVKANSDFSIDFVSAMIVLFFAKGVANLLIVYVFRRKLLKRYREVVKTSKKKVILPLVIDNFLCILKDFLYRFGFIIAPAMTFASVASDAVEPIVIFIMGIILTIINPKFGREKINRKSIIVHLISILLVVSGILLLNA